MTTKGDKQTVRDKFLEIITYHSEDPLGGTSGYCLSNEQIEQAMSLFAHEYQSLKMEEATSDYAKTPPGYWWNKVSVQQNAKLDTKIQELQGGKV